MNYTGESLRGGGGCCKDKNTTFTVSPAKDFSSFEDDFGEFEDDMEDEEACWNVTRDDSHTVLTGKYEFMNRDCLEDEDDEADDFLDRYLLSMSPIIEKKTKNGQSGKGKKAATNTLPRRPHDVSVKCSDSTEEIVGTPSEVALRLSEAIQHYLPRRKMRIEREVGKEASVALEEEFEKEEEDPVQSVCPELGPPCPPKLPTCPGTFDKLQRKNVSCADAWVLREIALGRRITRPSRPDLPMENDGCDQLRYTQPMGRENPRGHKNNCCCAKRKNREPRKSSPPPSPQSCCTKQPKTNKSVSFSF